jgi:membrane-associated phospholipid phosphatase
VNSIIRVDDAVTFGYLACITLVVIAFHQRVRYAWAYPLIHLVWAGVILVLVQMAERKPTFPWIHARNWYHVLSIPLAFRELNYLVHPVHPRDLDPLLAKVDSILFGVDPTVWLEPWIHPWFTEYLQITYSSFYLLPLILAILLWRSSDNEAFGTALTGIVTAFYLSYLGYFGLPALGPRFELAHLQHIELHGVFLADWLRGSLDRLELIQRDAFPSGHTAVSLVVLYYVRRFRPGLFVLSLVIICSLVFSTVYLRYHYVVDVFAGILLAGLSLVLVRVLRNCFGFIESGGLPHYPISKAGHA